jgi:hypothetical protein
MEALPVLVIVAVVVAVALFLGMGRASQARRRAETEDDLAQPATSTLDYVVPPGQDPVVLLTALSAEGYTAVTDPRQNDLLHIACPSGPDRDRAHVRGTIAAVHTTAVDAGAPMEPGDVRFLDER